MVRFPPQETRGTCAAVRKNMRSNLALLRPEGTPGSKVAPWKANTVDRRRARRKATRVRLLATAILLTMTGCSLRVRQVPAGEPFDLLPGERVSIRGTGLTIELGTVGHAWTVDGAETPFADVTVMSGFQRRTQELAVGETWQLDGVTIRLRAADPFGANRCTLEVARSGESSPRARPLLPRPHLARAHPAQILHLCPPGPRAGIARHRPLT